MINWPENIKLKETKYSKWYESLMHKAQLRGLVNGYKETHHIIPRCFGGDDSKKNLVHLTAREHYIAHALLWKIKFEGIYGSKMAFAFNTFINKMTTKERGVNHTYTISSRMYETFRKHYSQMLKEKYAREGGTFTGRKHSEETKRKIGEKSKLKEFKRGPENPNWGKKRKVSAEENAQRSASIKKIWADPTYKAMMMAKRQAFLNSPEGIKQRKNTSSRTKGVKRDPAHTEGMRAVAAARTGKKWEEIYTVEQIGHMLASVKNKVYTPEGKARQIESSRKNGLKPKSEEHKRKISESNKKHDRWWTRGENNPNFGKPMLPHVKEKLKEANLKKYKERQSNMFVGPIKPDNTFTFRGTVYRGISEAARNTGIPPGKMKRQIKYWSSTPDAETIRKIDSGELTYPKVPAYNKGLSMSEEQKLLCSIKQKERLEKIRAQGLALPNTGRTASVETRKKISEKAVGRKASEETKIKLSLAKKGKAKSPEHIESIRLAKLRKKQANI